MVKTGTAGRYRGEGGGRAVVIHNLLLNQRKIVREKMVFLQIMADRIDMVMPRSAYFSSINKFNISFRRK